MRSLLRWISHGSRTLTRFWTVLKMPLITELKPEPFSEIGVAVGCTNSRLFPPAGKSFFTGRLELDGGAGFCSVGKLSAIIGVGVAPPALSRLSAAGDAAGIPSPVGVLEAIFAGTVVWLGIGAAVSVGGGDGVLVKVAAMAGTDVKVAAGVFVNWGVDVGRGVLVCMAVGGGILG